MCFVYFCKRFLFATRYGVVASLLVMQIDFAIGAEPPRIYQGYNREYGPHQYFFWNNDLNKKIAFTNRDWSAICKEFAAIPPHPRFTLNELQQGMFADFACGGGGTVLELQRLGVSSVGFDIQPQMNSGYWHVQSNLVEWGSLGEPFINQFDRGISYFGPLSYLGYFDASQNMAMLDNMSRATKPGGYVLVGPFDSLTVQAISMMSDIMGFKIVQAIQVPGRIPGSPYALLLQKISKEPLLDSKFLQREIELVQREGLQRSVTRIQGSLRGGVVVPSRSVMGSVPRIEPSIVPAVLTPGRTEFGIAATTLNSGTQASAEPRPVSPTRVEVNLLPGSSLPSRVALTAPVTSADPRRVELGSAPQVTQKGRVELEMNARRGIEVDPARGAADFARRRR